jgi:hypothetical protein
MDLTTIWNWVEARAAEPTTWRGLIGLATAAGVVINPHQAAMILAGGVGLAGFIGVVSKDPKNYAADVTAAIQDVVIPVAEAAAANAVANTVLVANTTVVMEPTPAA